MAKLSSGFVSGFVVELVSWDLKGLDNVCAHVAPLKSMGPFLKSPGNYRVGKCFLQNSRLRLNSVK